MAFAPRYGGNSAFLRTNTLVCENTRVMGKNCDDIWERSARGNRPQSGIYKIQMPGLDAKDVHCVFGEGSPKTVIQRRTTGDLNFNRDWRDYKYGFSTNVEASPYTGQTHNSGGQRGPRPTQCNLKEYWIGLEYIHALTKAGFNNLRIDLERWNGEEGTVTYGNFDVASEREQYRLTHVDGFENDANRDLGDAFRGTGFGDQGYSQYDQQDTDHKSMAFSTYDRDNDLYEEGNCAREDGSGWWFNRCSAANLNGKHYGNKSSAFKAKNDASFDDGILWMTWTKNKFESLTGTTMMLGGIDANKNEVDVPRDNCQAHADSLFDKDLMNEHNAEDFNGVYSIWVDQYMRESKKVECKFYVKLDTPCGLTLIQKRKDGSEEFNRNWADYKKGFGFDVVANRGPRPGKSLGEGVTEGWLGNDAIWHLTNNLESQGLLVEMDRKYDPRTKSDNSAACRYNDFKIGDERSRYTLYNIDGYSSVSGNPGDAFAGADFGREGWGNDREITRHRGMKFSTKDQDNDADQYYHCAREDKSGWWFNGCSAVNLNGHYYSSGIVEGGSKGSQMTRTEEFDDGILWETWTATKWESLTATRMYVGDSNVMNVIFSGGSSSTIYPDDTDREDSSRDVTYYKDYIYDQNRGGKPDYDDFYYN